jgi:hypothetical protein
VSAPEAAAPQAPGSDGGRCPAGGCRPHASLLTAVECAAALDPVIVQADQRKFGDTDTAKAADAYLAWLAEAGTPADACLRRTALRLACDGLLRTGTTHQKILTAAKAVHLWMCLPRRLSIQH